ncbi:hypothetical protein [Streptococcus marmotae]|uniref:hypothetical protein n=1 Tax=Streptococcus marmotae TaxID=1825069 RepID=UPI00082D0232|nr:hypothetical protein [Streptococcus marmotae]
MFKIIKINGDTIFVGKGDGQFTEIHRSAFGFEPKIGDQVEFYENNGEYIVSKVDNLAQFANFSNGMGIKGQSSKSKVVAGILAFFGPLYHFYIGKTVIGIVWLAICILCGVTVALAPMALAVSTVISLINCLLVLTSKPGSKWHQDAQGLELQD